jgi:hypothetical protein
MYVPFTQFSNSAVPNDSEFRRSLLPGIIAGGPPNAPGVTVRWNVIPDIDGA